MTETATAKRSRGGRCCLLGCGAIFLLGVLLLLSGWLGYRRYGAPWIDARKTEITQRFPAVGRFLRLKDALSLDAITFSGGEGGDRSTSGFPSDIWLPEDAESAAFNSTPNSALAALTLPTGETDAVAGRIRQQMSNLGWQRTPVRDPHDGMALLFEKDGRAARYLVFPTDQGLELWVRSP
jgi:hypothetical protein